MVEIVSLAVIFLIGHLLFPYFTWVIDMLLMMPFLYMVGGIHGVLLTAVEFALKGLAAFLILIFPYVGLYFLVNAVLQEIGLLNWAKKVISSKAVSFGLGESDVLALLYCPGCSLSGQDHIKKRDAIDSLFISFLLALFPCSAKVIIVIALVGNYAGVFPAMLVLALDGVVFFLALLVFRQYRKKNKFKTKSEPFDGPMVFQKPKASKIYHSWKMAMAPYFNYGFPMIIVGSILVGYIKFFGLHIHISDLLDPVTVAVFGLPGLAVLCLFLGFLRKELALESFALVSGIAFGLFLTAGDVFVFGLMATVSIPCLGFLVSLFRINGPKRAGLMIGVNILLVILMGVIGRLIALVLF